MHFKTQTSLMLLCWTIGYTSVAVAGPTAAVKPRPAAAVPAGVLVGVLDTIRLYNVRSDYPFLVPKVLPGVVTAKHLTLVVTKRGLLLSPGVATVDITDDVVAALRADPAIAALPPPVSTEVVSDHDTIAPAPVVPSGPAPVALTVTRKGFHAATQTGDDIKSYIEISCQFTNMTGKAITSLNGTIEFDDLQGTLVQSAQISLPLAIGAHKHVSWDGTISYSEYLEEDQKLRKLDLSALKEKFVSVTVNYADGTSGSQ